MRIFLRGLTMTAALLSTSAAYADQQPSSFVGDSEAEYYGTESSVANAGMNESFGNEGAVLQTSATAHVGDESEVTPQTAVRSASLQAPSPYQAAGFRNSHATMAAPCDNACDGSCQGACDGGCRTRGRMTQMMGGKCPEIWLQAETLLWFPQARRSPALAATAPAGEFPDLSNPNAVPIGEQFGNTLTPGLRLDAGRYFAGGNFGIGGRFWTLADDDDSFSLSGDGTTQSIGRPFFNASPGAGFEDAVQIGFEDGSNDTFDGSVSAVSSLSIIAAEAYGRLNFVRGNEYHVDFIGGYSYFDIDDDLFITSRSTDKQDGGVTLFTDNFNTSNSFQGGQIGAETILRRGRWVARSLTKVHLGNMNQQVVVSGTGSVSATNVSPTLPFGDGLLAGGANGNFDQDVFAFAPEMNLKLGYRFRDHVTFSVGYSFIYWSQVALAGEQINRNLDINPVTGVQPRSLPYEIRSAGYWAQGIDLGTTIEF
jgi:hypothetical protein